MEKFTAEELKKFLFEEKKRYLNIYFSIKTLEGLLAKQFSNDKGISVDVNIWRKEEIINLHGPLMVAAEGAGWFYSMDFCTEYRAGQ